MCTRISSRGSRLGFTLVELIVVLVIISLVTAAVLGSGLVGAINHRQVSEAGRLLQGTLVGARDQAIHDGQPSGIRLLPDPAFPIAYMTNAAGQIQIDPAAILAYNRIVPIGPAPEYTEGLVTVQPAGSANANYPGTIMDPYGTGNSVPSLILESAPFDANGLPTSPTSWFWNIRVGDQVQINNAGPWYTVAGPQWVGAQPVTFTDCHGQKVTMANTEMFVNCGSPGCMPTLPSGISAEFLVLVDGRDGNGNGWADEGWNGVDEDGDGLVDETTCPLNPGGGEWIEKEAWPSGLAGGRFAVPYTIRRRPAPLSGSREIALPTSIVIDATSVFVTGERSRLPVNRYNGTVDIMVNPDGTVLPVTLYGVPASVGMAGAFYHFWIAERQDLAAMSGTTTPALPVGLPGGASSGAYPIPTLKGEYSLVTLFTRSGNIVVNANPPFDDPIAAASQGRPYNVNLPYTAAQQGIRGQ